MASGVRNFKYSIFHKNQRQVVCPKAFELIHGITRYCRKELTRDVNGASEIVRFRNKGNKVSKSTKRHFTSMLKGDALAGFDAAHLFAMGTIASTERTQMVGCANVPTQCRPILLIFCFLFTYRHTIS